MSAVGGALGRAELRDLREHRDVLEQDRALNEHSLRFQEVLQYNHSHRDGPPPQRDQKMRKCVFGPAAGL